MIAMNDKDYTIGSDNIFADLGLPDAEELLMQADLSYSIVAEISRRELTRRQAASLLGIPQTRVSDLLHAHLNGFSLENLQQMRAKLGMDVALSCERTSW